MNFGGIVVFVVGIFFGLIISPLFEYFLSYFAVPGRKKKVHIDVQYIPTEQQYASLLSSNHICNDLSWFNVLLQRYFIELTQSYAYKDKLRRTAISKFKKIEKFAKLEIDKLDVGKEFPYFKSVKVLSTADLEEISRNRPILVNSVVESNSFVKNNNLSESENIDLRYIEDEFKDIEMHMTDNEPNKNLISSGESDVRSDLNNENQNCSVSNLTNSAFMSEENEFVDIENIEYEKSEEHFFCKDKEIMSNNNDFKIISSFASTIKDTESHFQEDNKKEFSDLKNRFVHIDKNPSLCEKIVPDFDSVSFQKEKSKSLDMRSTLPNFDNQTLRNESNRNTDERKFNRSDNIQKEQCESVIYKTMSTVGSKTKNINQEKNNDIPFNNITVLFDFEYNGTILMESTVFLPRGYKLPVKFMLKYLKGKVLVRLPSLTSHTKYEISFLKIDKLEFNIVTTFKNSYFVKTVSNFLKKVFITAFHKTFLYPNFAPQNLPNVSPSAKIVNYEHSSIGNEDEAMIVLNDILLIMSMYYKQVKFYPGIVLRKGTYNVNQTKNRILMHQIDIKEIVTLFKTDLSKMNLKNYNKYEIFCKEKNINNNSSMPHMEFNDKIVDNDNIGCNYDDIKIKFNDAETTRLFIKAFILNLEILKDVILDFESIEIIEEHKKYTKISLHFKTKCFVFIRMVYEDSVIFQSNFSNEFIAFKLRNMQFLEVYFYLNNPYFKISEKSAVKLRDKLSIKNYNILKDIISKKEKKDLDSQSTSSVKSSIIVENPYEYLKNLFDFLDQEQETSIFENTEIKKMKIEINIHNLSDLLINNHNLRFKLYLEEFSSQLNESKNEYKMYTIYSRNDTITCLSFISKNIIIDLYNNHRITAFVLENEKDSQITVLNLYYFKNFETGNFHSFLFALKIIEKQNKYKKNLIPLDDFSLESNVFSKDYSLNNCSMCIEIETRETDEFYFYLYNKTRGSYCIEKLKILGTKNGGKARFIASIPDKNVLNLYMKSKQGLLFQKVRVFLNMEKEFIKDTLIDCTAQFGPKKSFLYSINASSSVSTFWDFGKEDLNIILKNKETKSVIKGTGIVLMKEGKYIFSLQNPLRTKTTAKIFLGSSKIEI